MTNYNSNDTKALRQKLKCLLSQPSTVHSHFSADQFLQHFSGKISRIREATARLDPPDIYERNIDIPLSDFRPATVAEVTAIMKKSPAKQCSADPMPTWLLKDLSVVIALIITAMCNASISQGKFQSAHKSAIVRPRLKKPSLDTADLNSYRPISNLSFVSEVLERIIDSRLTEHANYNVYSHSFNQPTASITRLKLLWSRCTTTSSLR